MAESICSQFVSGVTGAIPSVNAGASTTIIVKNFRNGIIGIKNTGATNTIQYKIDSQITDSGGIIVSEVSYTDIAPLAQATFDITKARYCYIVTVKSKVTDAASNYITEYCAEL